MQLNVSLLTVSRALSDHPRIGISTKERVQKLAKEMGYEPSTQAIYFKQKKTFIIGVILPDIKEDFFSQAISGIETAATLHHYTMLFGQSYGDMEIEKRLVGVMRKQRVDGLIISLSKATNKYHHLFHNTKNVNASIAKQPGNQSFFSRKLSFSSYPDNKLVFLLGLYS